MIKNFIGILLIPLLICYFVQFYNSFFLIFQQLYKFQGLIVGTICFIIIRSVFYRRKKENFFGNFVHELTHYLFALLFFRRVSSFKAYSRYGGEINLYGGNFAIALAPYFFPVFTIFFMLLKLVIIDELKIYTDFFIGFTYAFHIVLILKDFNLSQPDVKYTGRFFSVIFVVFANFIIFSSILIISGKGYGFLVNYYKNGFILLKSFFACLFN